MVFPLKPPFFLGKSHPKSFIFSQGVDHASTSQLISSAAEYIQRAQRNGGGNQQWLL
jgi:hypothetical protein